MFIANSLFGQPDNRITGDVIMPSPTAASLGKYIEAPINQSTGIPDISIPLHVVQDGRLNLPISLKYHLGGLKVAESASDVGMGWSLHTGGVITRSVQGIPDELEFGYINSFDEINNRDEYTTHVQNELFARVDTEPDVFTFSAGGYSGKFFYTKNKWVPVPLQNVKIESFIDNTLNPEMIVGFKITIPDGTKYLFGKFKDPLCGTESSDGIETSEPPSPLPSTSVNYYKYASTWHLVRIESADGYNQIDLEYENSYYGILYRTYSEYINNKVITQSNEICEASFTKGLEQPKFYQMTNSVNGKYLTRITSSTDNVNVVYEDTWREDVDPHGNLLFREAYAINYIEINNGSFVSIRPST